MQDSGLMPGTHIGLFTIACNSSSGVQCPLGSGLYRKEGGHTCIHTNKETFKMWKTIEGHTQHQTLAVSHVGMHRYSHTCAERETIMENCKYFTTTEPKYKAIIQIVCT